MTAQAHQSYAVTCNGQAFRVVDGRRVWQTQPPAAALLEMQLDAASAALAIARRSRG